MNPYRIANRIFPLAAFLVLFVLFALAPYIANAQSRLQYPIAQLGYCRDAKECALYCDIPKNTPACWSYGKYTLGPQVLGATTVSDEEKKSMEAEAKKRGISFPIADLGNCTGPVECRNFCEEPSNYQACMAFATKHGFSKEPPPGVDTKKKEELLGKAKTELGCTSMESCRQTCESNPTRCDQFARRHGVYQQPPEKAQLMEKAKTELGCTSMEACRQTCETDPDRCREFAQRHGFDRSQNGPSPYPPGPSGSPRPSYQGSQYQTRPYQSDQPQSSTFTKKCDSEASCKNYCTDHPDECPGFNQAQERMKRPYLNEGSTTGSAGSSYPPQYPKPTMEEMMHQNSQPGSGGQAPYQSQYQPPSSLTTQPSYPSTEGQHYTPPTEPR